MHPWRPRLLILALLCLLPGCSDRIDIDRRMVVSPIGIDKAAGSSLKVTLRMPLLHPMGMQTGNQGSNYDKAFVLRSQTAAGIYPAIIQAQNEDEHALFMGQCRAVVFGEAFARSGIKPCLDFFERFATFPRGALAVVARPDAAALLEVAWPEQELHDQNIRYFFENGGSQVTGRPIWSVSQSICTPLEDPAIPLVAPAVNGTTMRLLGLAVFQRDRMVGEIDAEQAVLLEIIKNFRVAHRMTIRMGRDMISFRAVKGRSKIKASYRNGTPQFLISLKLKGFLAEDIMRARTFTPAGVKRLEDKFEVIMRGKILALLNKLREYGSDPIDLGNNLRIQDARRFSAARWRQDYKRAEFAVDVDFNVTLTGILK